MSPITRFDYEAPVPAVDELGRVHVLAIGGAGMSAVARLLLQAGLTVSGSDARDSAMLGALRADGATVWVGHEEAHLAGVDTVVVSSAIREDNVELAAARAAGLRVLHRSQALAALAAGRVPVAVAGANGKTTTTSMLTVALIDAGADPSYAIGGELSAAGTNAHVGGGRSMVIEADESDGSFLAYRPQVAIVTNVQPDHLDFYGTFEAVQDAYLRFTGTIRPGGLLVACADDAGSLQLAQRAAAAGVRVLTYGTAPEADLRLCEVRFDGMTGRARLAGPASGEGGELVIEVPGEHNLRNAAAAYLAATAGLGARPAEVLAGLRAYSGTRRRFEAKGEAAGVRVVDDYAHNPGKVAAVVATAAPLARPGRLVAVFQPHLYSRTRDFAQSLAAGLAPADVAVILDVYAAREDPMPGVSGDLVAEHLRALPGERQVRYVPDKASAPRVVAELVRPGDLVLTVGAGDVTDVGPAVLELLEANPPPQ
ncbi:UDP-N-acetylmuramate--alanine ligase [Kineosphaera limosa]|uniref:UDP-N-acetylmuramate--L-alanine ligase n=1 Tax=Kineosphaera limosa NBRC 100340 TaxID=1184609 RepID=K6VJB9_9MICO|nr:UDP-N-acetylmuramate--L-alanine ligase [Kineosphaera limosa]NYD99260.1 UDP-N-acetylmuramate--alanine ligase [Kineosphaera limosa]GAB96298.1 UDP-N-acetylmuramate--L-alanine ligase [Kineosphaera limosa NBRC 100340]